MIGKLVRSVLSFFNLAADSAGAEAEARRRYIRYGGIRAEVTGGSRDYSVRDWSLGGVSFETAPDASLTVGDKLQVVLRFRFLHDTITIQQPAHIVRTAHRGPSESVIRDLTIS